MKPVQREEIGPSRKLETGKPRDTLELLRQIQERCDANGAAVFVDPECELKDPEALRKTVDEYSEQADRFQTWLMAGGVERYVWQDHFKKYGFLGLDPQGENPPPSQGPPPEAWPLSTHDIEMRKDYREQLRDAEARLKSANDKCGVVLEFINQSLGSSIKESIGAFTGPVYMQLRGMIAAISEKYMGDHTKVKDMFQGLLDELGQATTLTEARVLCENIDVYASGYSRYRKVCVTLLDRQAMDMLAAYGHNPPPQVFRQCGADFTDAELYKMLVAHVDITTSNFKLINDITEQVDKPWRGTVDKLTLLADKMPPFGSAGVKKRGAEAAGSASALAMLAAGAEDIDDQSSFDKALAEQDSFQELGDQVAYLVAHQTGPSLSSSASALPSAGGQGSGAPRFARSGTPPPMRTGFRATDPRRSPVQPTYLRKRPFADGYDAATVRAMQEQNLCFAFQKGNCQRGTGCRFEHRLYDAALSK